MASYVSPFLIIIPCPLNRNPFRNKGSTTFISRFAFFSKFLMVFGDRISANARVFSSQAIMVPFGERLGIPFSETVATYPNY